MTLTFLRRPGQLSCRIPRVLDLSDCFLLTRFRWCVFPTAFYQKVHNASLFCYWWCWVWPLTSGSTERTLSLWFTVTFLTVSLGEESKSRVKTWADSSMEKLKVSSCFYTTNLLATTSYACLCVCLMLILVAILNWRMKVSIGKRWRGIQRNKLLEDRNSVLFFYVFWLPYAMLDT